MPKEAYCVPAVEELARKRGDLGHNRGQKVTAADSAGAPAKPATSAGPSGAELCTGAPREGVRGVPAKPESRYVHTSPASTLSTSPLWRDSRNGSAYTTPTSTLDITSR